MPVTDTTLKALTTGVDLPTNTRNTFKVRRNHAELIEIDERQFTPDGAVLLPIADPAPEKLKLATISGISIVAHALEYAEEHGDRVLTIAAHAEDRGDPGIALAMSARRMDHVHALLKGDKSTWVKSCEGCDVRTLQLLLRWASLAHGRGTGLEQIDGVNNSDTRAALASFRAATAEANGSSEPPAELLLPVATDFEAFYDLYEASIAELLEIEPDGLAAARGKLKFHSVEKIACGGFWRPPTGPSADHVRSAGKRRIDLVFFESAEPIPELTGIEPPGRQLYESEAFAQRLYLEAIAPPAAICIRMTGMFFDTNKNFMLPSALPGIRKMVLIYKDNPEGKLLIVGHTDTTAEPSVNDPLSLERAESVAAYLKDDVDTWLKRYETSVPAKKRWGAAEDSLMLRALPDFGKRPAGQKPVEWFQQTRGLEVDGIAGPQTRTQLIKEYMAIDGTSLPSGIEAVPHGCGENFPLVATGNNVEEGANRRVELYLFAEEIDPPPPGPNSASGSSEYPKWRKQTVLQHELDKQTKGDELVIVLRRRKPETVASLFEDEPAAIEPHDELFTLSSESFRQEQPADIPPPGEDGKDDTVTVTFRGMPTNEVFTLTARHDGEDLVLFKDVPYVELADLQQKSATPQP